MFGKPKSRTYFPGAAIAALVLFLAILILSSQALSHGGKSHASSFTALQALQKATELYDKLVVSGKLDESWETTLNQVEISSRRKSDQKEYVVTFRRSNGEPSKVYIFFSADGKYTGSNFTGK
jgi:hypothetical protein